MVTNKSIDGLSTRAAKTAASRSTASNHSTHNLAKPYVSRRLTSPRLATKHSASTTKLPTSVTRLSTSVTKHPTSTKRHSVSTTKPSVSVTKQPATASIPTEEDLTEAFASAPTANIWDSIKVTEHETESISNADNILDESSSDYTNNTDDNLTDNPNNNNADILTLDELSDSNDSLDTTDFLKPVQAFDFSEEEGLIESDDTVASLKKSASTQDDEIDEEHKDDMPKNNKKSKKAQKDIKKAKKPNKKRRTISIIALIIVLLLIGGILWLVFFGNDLIAKLTGGRGNILDLLTFTSETYEPLKTDENGRTNILAFGTGGYDMSGEEGGGVHDGAQLTDSIMLISFDQKTGDVAMVSLPRDLKGPSTCTSTGKINEIYWCNGGGGDATIEEEEKAANALMTAVGSILGVDIQYYAHLNWGSIVSIVDILDGITVTLDEDILDYYYTGAVYKAGVPYTINGAEAVGLARARHGTTGGDFSRGASQQKIIIGIKNRIFEKKLSLADLLSLVTTLGDNLRTNFSLNEMKTLAHSAEIFDFDSMRQISLYPDYMTTGNINGISYVLPKAGVGSYGAIQLYLSKQLSSDPRDYEEPTIAIYNASDTAGLAADERAKLEKEGYTITTIDNTPEGEYPAGTTIYYINPAKPSTKALLEDYYNIYLTPADQLPTALTPNHDFIIILNDKD